LIICLQITTSLLDGGPAAHTLMLADTESEKAKWIAALSELHRILKRNNLPNTAIFRLKEVLDSSLSTIRNALSSLIIDPERLLMGTEDGLFCLDLDRSGEFELVVYFFFRKSQFLIHLTRNRSNRRIEKSLPTVAHCRRTTAGGVVWEATSHPFVTNTCTGSHRRGMD
jgi:hypothetical protein